MYELRLFEVRVTMQLPISIVRQLDRLMRYLGGVDRRAPDFLIGGATNPYMKRWWVIPRNRWFNIYYHQMLRDDEDRALHDHMYVNMSIVLDGGYYEVMPYVPAHEVIKTNCVERHVGAIVFRRPTQFHRIVLRRVPKISPMLPGDRPQDPGPVNIISSRSLFITGPRVRNWGFACPKGWIPWQEFVNMKSPGEIGPGCPE